MERELLSLGLRPRDVPVRRVLAVGWDIITDGTAWWQREMLLADCATWVNAHSHAIAILEALVKSRQFPKAEFPKIRRALYFARKREDGQEVPGD